MQVGINTSSFSHLKFNFEFADQKLKSIEKGFQIGSCKIIQSYRLSLSSLRLGQLLTLEHWLVDILTITRIGPINRFFWHLARWMCGGVYLLLYSNLYWKRFSRRVDYLKITNGIKEARYCGDRHSVRDLLVSGNYVVLTFHSDWLLENKKGFEILFAEEKGNNFIFGAIYARKNKTCTQNKTRTLPFQRHILSEIRQDASYLRIALNTCS